MFDLTILALCLFIVVNLIIQVVSFVKLIKFLTTSDNARKTLYLGLVLLSTLYLHDVFSMLLYFWGLPAFTMTDQSYLGKETINHDARCLVDFSIQDETQWKLQQFKKIWNFSFSISLISRLIWTLLLFGGLVYLQHASKTTRLEKISAFSSISKQINENFDSVRSNEVSS